ASRSQGGCRSHSASTPSAAPAGTSLRQPLAYVTSRSTPATSAQRPSAPSVRSEPSLGISQKPAASAPSTQPAEFHADSRAAAAGGAGSSAEQQRRGGAAQQQADQHQRQHGGEGVDAVAQHRADQVGPDHFQGEREEARAEGAGGEDGADARRLVGWRRAACGL